MTVKEAIKKSGTTNILAFSSTKKAQNLIEDGEEILYAINTNVIIEDMGSILKSAKGLFSMTNTLNGVVVVTDRRIIFCSSIMGRNIVKQIFGEDINAIEENINGLMKIGQIRIIGITESLVINIFNSKVVNELIANINKCREINSTTTQSNYQVSTADEILKFKKLLDEGIITQEEFERKKQELLT